MWYKKEGMLHLDPFRRVPFNRDFNPETKEIKSLQCLTKNKGRTRSVEKSEDTENAIRKLKELYKPFNQKLFEMIGKKFDWN